jgi:hypothetical protein
MAEIKMRHDVHTDEDTYWPKIVFNEAFNKEMYEGHLRFPAWTLLDFKDDDQKTYRKVRVEPKVGDLPGPVKKVLGDRMSYVEEGTFDKKTKRYTFKVTPSALPDKSKIAGEMWCEKAGDKKCVRHTRISVEVKVLMVGGLVEQRVLKDLEASYDAGSAFTNEYIAKHNL